jgi:hypothetical protein
LSGAAEKLVVSDDEQISLRRQLGVLLDVARCRPLATVRIIGRSIFAALLKRVGLSFLVPVIELAQGNTEAEEMSGVEEVFSTFTSSSVFRSHSSLLCGGRGRDDRPVHGDVPRRVADRGATERPHPASD